MPITLDPGEERQLDIALTPIPVLLASLFGYVTDAETGLPIVGAVIDLSGEPGAYSIATNSQGYYQFLDILPGTYAGQVSAAGYEPYTF